MISLLIASLIDSGKLNLDEYINDIDFNQTYPQIYHAHKNSNSSYLLTLRQLMSEMPVIQVINSSQPFIYCEKLIDIFEEPFSQEKLRFYESSLAWDMITDRLEDQTLSYFNQTFPTALNQFLFRKINLESTQIYSEGSIIPYSVRYYNKNESRLENYGSDDEIPVSCWPSSAITSTTTELLMFGRKAIDIYNNKFGNNSYIKLYPVI